MDLYTIDQNEDKEVADVKKRTRKRMKLLLQTTALIESMMNKPSFLQDIFLDDFDLDDVE